MCLRTLGFVVAVGCSGSARQPVPTQTVTVMPLPSPSTSAPATASTATPPVSGPAESVRTAIDRWLGMLDAGEDGAFIDEAVVPEELSKVLGRKTKDELVHDFQEDKHADMIELFHEIRAREPTSVTDAGGDTLVLYKSKRLRDVTFVVRAGKVYIKN